MKSKISNILMILAFFLGISLLLYPAVSDYYNSLHQSHAVARYSEQISHLSQNKYSELLEEAYRYNEKLAQRPATSFVLSPSDAEAYHAVLNVAEVMSYIEIPSIRCMLPIYHGVDDTVLGSGVGHVPGSSLPVGGDSTHCVLSGHRGLPTAKLFTDLDKVMEGDRFILRTLDEILTYEVDQIRIVEPDDISSLELARGKDYCTLVTCTPYGINTQRLLVRGVRLENQKEPISICVMADAVQIEPMVVAPFAATPVFLVMLIWVLQKPSKKERRNSKA